MMRVEEIPIKFNSHLLRTIIYKININNSCVPSPVYRKVDVNLILETAGPTYSKFVLVCQLIVSTQCFDHEVMKT